MMLSKNSDYYASKGFDSNVVDYFTNYPLCFMIFWVLNLICGFISPILLVARKKYAHIVALISTVSDAILILLTSLFKNRIGVLGINIFLFDIFILVITYLFYLYCLNIYRKRKLSVN